jgi:hypothetical protein
VSRKLLSNEEAVLRAAATVSSRTIPRLTIQILCSALDLVGDSFNLGLGITDNSSKSLLRLSANISGRANDPILIHDLSPLGFAYVNAALANWFTRHNATGQDLSPAIFYGAFNLCKCGACR